jgi:hypothetical protein
MPELMLTSFSKNSSLSRTLARPGYNKNLLQANLDAVTLLGQGTESSTDMKGQVLRQLRLIQSLDPAVLATEACISVAQLYEIEKGIDHLFYSDTLRQQAARRVAQLLGIDWDLIDESHLNIQTATNVVSLQRGPVVRGFAPAFQNTPVSPSLTLAPVAAPSPIDIAVNSHLANLEPSAMAPSTPMATSVATPTTFALGLSTPSADSELTEQPEEKLLSTSVDKTNSGHSLWWLLTLVGLAAAGFFVAEQEGYVRQYWPEFYQWLRQVQRAF